MNNKRKMKKKKTNLSTVKKKKNKNKKNKISQKLVDYIPPPLIPTQNRKW
jgi:hypothetical protein